jgi:hypothetical protein
MDTTLWVEQLADWIAPQESTPHEDLSQDLQEGILMAESLLECSRQMQKLTQGWNDKANV